MTILYVGGMQHGIIIQNNKMVGNILESAEYTRGLAINNSTLYLTVNSE
ncbi:MAG: hypothetical protein QXV17_10025 [Candidatus Micrarchaeaceae archaeon]